MVRRLGRSSPGSLDELFVRPQWEIRERGFYGASRHGCSYRRWRVRSGQSLSTLAARASFSLYLDLIVPSVIPSKSLSPSWKSMFQVNPGGRRVFAPC